MAAYKRTVGPCCIEAGRLADPNDEYGKRPSYVDLMLWSFEAEVDSRIVA